MHSLDELSITKSVNNLTTTWDLKSSKDVYARNVRNKKIANFSGLCHIYSYDKCKINKVIIIASVPKFSCGHVVRHKNFAHIPANIFVILTKLNNIFCKNLARIFL